MKMRSSRVLVAVLAGFLLFSPAVFPQSAAGQDSRYTVMAAFLYNFLLFTEWPTHDDLDSGPFLIGVVGSNPFERAAPTIEQRNAGGRDIRFAHFGSVDEIEPVHVLFVTREADAELAQIRKELESRPILLVGETGDFTRRGGIIRFFEEAASGRSEASLRVEINRTSADACGIRFRSQLLRLAQVVNYPVPSE